MHEIWSCKRELFVFIFVFAQQNKRTDKRTNVFLCISSVSLIQQHDLVMWRQIVVGWKRKRKENDPKPHSFGFSPFKRHFGTLKAFQTAFSVCFDLVFSLFFFCIAKFECFWFDLIMRVSFGCALLCSAKMWLSKLSGRDCLHGKQPVNTLTHTHTQTRPQWITKKSQKQKKIKIKTKNTSFRLMIAFFASTAKSTFMLWKRNKESLSVKN